MKLKKAKFRDFRSVRKVRANSRCSAARFDVCIKNAFKKSLLVRGQSVPSAKHIDPIRIVAQWLAFRDSKTCLKETGNCRRKVFPTIKTDEHTCSSSWARSNKLPVINWKFAWANHMTEFRGKHRTLAFSGFEGQGSRKQTAKGSS